MTTSSTRGISLAKCLLACSLAIATIFSIAFAAVPTKALAADNPAIALGTNTLETGCNTGDAQVVYFGVGTGADEKYDSMKWTDPYSWYVIGYGSTGAVEKPGAITLFATENIGATKFNDDSTHTDNVYAESLLQARLDYIADIELTTMERSAAIPRTLEIDVFVDKASSKPADYHEPFCNGIAQTAVEDAVMWPLSTQEAWDVDKDKRIDKNGESWTYEGKLLKATKKPTSDELYDNSNASNWWLRSPGQPSDGDNNAATTTGQGDVLAGGGDVDNVRGVRPAFYLNMEAVLFVSAAAGGKTDTLGSLSEVGSNSTNEWKLTLLDSYRGFAINEASVTGQAGDSVDLTYTGATVGVNDYVSAIIVDGDGNVIYYGKLDQATDSNGTVAVPIPSDFAADTYTLLVFDENCNGDYLTDYASDFSEVELAVEAAPAEATLTFDLAGGTLDGKTGIITVTATVGDKVSLLAAPTREGYTFKCWKGSEYAAGAEYTVEGDHEFTAEWEKDTPSSIPATGDGNGMTAFAFGVAALGSLIALAACATRRTCRERQSH